MIEYFNLTPGLINDNVNNNGLTISLVVLSLYKRIFFVSKCLKQFK